MSNKCIVLHECALLRPQPLLIKLKKKGILIKNHYFCRFARANDGNFYFILSKKTKVLYFEKNGA